MKLCTIDIGTGFSSSLILISSLFHYSFKAGEEKNKEREPIIKRWIKANWGGVKGKGPEIKGSQREATSALSPRTINMNAD